MSARRRRVAALAFSLLVAATAAQAVDIGRVERVVVWGYGTPPGAGTRDLFERAPVVESETVETPRDGAVHLRFDDQTQFRVGSESKAKLDRFVYDPQRGTGEMTLELSKGVFRFVSGRMQKQGYLIVTPTATIGIRGTDILIEVFANGDTIVTVLEGELLMNNRDTAQNAVVREEEQGFTRGGQAGVTVQRKPRLQRVVPETLETGGGRGGVDGRGGDAAGGGGGRGQ